ncbi:MAG: STAS domain-containing protein [Verrucomicrobiota bacterium]|nr:STAS domain-containing protein [Verrucomicrobiota bacterium]
MNIGETQSGELVVLALSGRLDGAAAPALEAQIARLGAGSARRVVFDCSGLDYISSAGLRVFLATARLMQSAGGHCGFAALSPQVRDVFRLSGFLELFEIHPTVADACA